AADQAHRGGVGGAEEGLGGGRAPVEQQAAAFGIGEADTSDVHRIGAVRGDDPAEAQVQSEAPQCAQAGGESVDLLVAVQCRLPSAAGGTAGRVEAVGEVGDRPLQARGDRREVPFVGGGQRRVGLGGEVVG